MSIAVMFDDYKVDFAPKTYFDLLLDAGCIIAFKRSDDEWVDIKVGPIRKNRAHNKYQGPERRERIQLFGYNNSP